MRRCYKCQRDVHRFGHMPSCIFCRKHVVFPMVHFVLHILDILAREADQKTIPDLLPDKEWADKRLSQMREEKDV